MSMNGKKPAGKKTQEPETKFKPLGRKRKTPVDVSGSGDRFSVSGSGAFNEEGVDVSKSLTSLADLPPTKQKKAVDLDFGAFDNVVEDDWYFDDADKEDEAPSPAKESVAKKPVEKALPSLKAKN